MSLFIASSDTGLSIHKQHHLCAKHKISKPPTITFATAVLLNLGLPWAVIDILPHPNRRYATFASWHCFDKTV
jgi:hypothetical protein